MGTELSGTTALTRSQQQGFTSTANVVWTVNGNSVAAVNEAAGESLLMMAYTLSMKCAYR